MPIPTQPQLTTAEQLFAQPSDGFRYELVSGELRMMSPAGGRHGRVTFRVGYLLNQHVEANKLGVVYAAETGFVVARDPDTVLAPDVAYISELRHREIVDDVRYIPISPDLTIEVLSPNDGFARVESKVMTWLEAGTKLVLVVDPERQTVQTYHSRTQIQIYGIEESVDCTIAVPGWHLRVQDIFS